MNTGGVTPAVAILLLLLNGCSLLATDAVEETPRSRGATMPSTINGVDNFAQVSPILYRGEQPTAAGFATLKSMGIKTIVNLRSFHGDSGDLKGLGLRYFHIYAKAWHPEDEDMILFLKIVQDPKNQPVFVHCQQGSDRTGYSVAVYRMVEQGWTSTDAIAELHHFAFHKIWTDVPAYLKAVDVKAIREQVKNAEMPVVRVIE